MCQKNLLFSNRFNNLQLHLLFIRSPQQNVFFSHETTLEFPTIKISPQLSV